MAYAQDPPEPGQVLDDAAATLVDELAADPDDIMAADGAQVIPYEPEFFYDFSPVTALDAISRLPGFSLDTGDASRGFTGTAGNVLINGERPSSKSSSVADVLGRTPFDRVERIELILGQSGASDVRGQTKIANVVLSAAESVSGAYQLATQYTNADDRLTWEGDIALSAELLGWTTNLSLERSTFAQRRVGPEDTILPDGTLLVSIDETDQRSEREWSGAIDLSRDLGLGRIQLNGSGFGFQFDRTQNEIVNVPDGLGGLIPDNVIQFVRIDRETGFELGGDYERPLSTDLSFKIIALQTLNFFTGSSINSSFGLDTVLDSTSTFLSSDTAGESILQGKFNWRAGDSHAVEIGLEGAYNFLSSTVGLSVDGVETPLPASDTRVAEARGKLFAADVWQIASDLTLESGFQLEVSRIAQAGEGGLTRIFVFPKPSANLTWNATSQDQFRLEVARQVSQLNFGDFVSSVSLTTDQINFGNPDLEPERFWSVNTIYERQLGRAGLVSINGFIEFFQDVEDQIPLLDDDAPGNIGNGRRFGVALEGETPLSFIGLENFRVEWDFVVDDTRVIDPVTFQPRRFNSFAEASAFIEWRHDLPDLGFSWGGDWFWRPPDIVFRIDEEEVGPRGTGDVDLFFETTRLPFVTLRFDAENLGNVVDERDRFFFLDTRASGIVTDIDTRDRRNGRRFTLSVRGTF
ncbi:MAG: TonB-dependent receptor plug domain-containing protein [Maricaulaceae bacterium]